MGIDLPYRITALESEAVKPLPTLLPECAADLRGFAAASKCPLHLFDDTPSGGASWGSRRSHAPQSAA